MRAKVKQSYRWNSIVLFSGCEFVKNEFRPVPVGHEEQATKQAELFIEPEKVDVPVVDLEGIIEPVKEKSIPVVMKQPAKRRH